MSSTRSALLAAARLEAAVERLVEALSRRPPGGGTVSRAELAALTARLDETLARLRAAVEDGEG